MKSPVLRLLPALFFSIVSVTSISWEDRLPSLPSDFELIQGDIHSHFPALRRNDGTLVTF